MAFCVLSDWKQYPVLNVPFDSLGLHPDAAAAH